MTVIAELALENDDYLEDVIASAPLHSDAAIRRVGWVLDRIAGVDGLEALRMIAAGTAKQPSLLYPHAGRTTNIDRTWMIDVNREVDPDL